MVFFVLLYGVAIGLATFNGTVLHGRHPLATAMIAAVAIISVVAVAGCSWKTAPPPS